MGKTLFDKIWDNHIVKSQPGFPDVVYINTHFIHEVTSPQAFDGLRKRGIPVFRTAKTRATADHNVPTIDQHLPIKEALSRKQVEMLTTINASVTFASAALLLAKSTTLVCLAFAATWLLRRHSGAALQSE